MGKHDFSIFDQGRISDEVGAINDLLLGFGAVYPNKENVSYSYNKMLNKCSDLGARLIKNDELNRYYLTLEVPRFSKDEITVEFENNTIMIKGERVSEPVKGPYNFDYSSKKFNFKYTFPEKVSIVEADLRNGILTITATIAAPSSLKIPIK